MTVIIAGCSSAAGEMCITTLTRHKLLIEEKIENREIRTHSFPNLDPYLKFFLQKSLNNLEECTFYSVPRTRKMEPQ